MHRLDGPTIGRGGEISLAWSSPENRSYRLLCSTNLTEGFNACTASNLVATPPRNTLTNLSTIADRPQAIAVELE